MAEYDTGSRNFERSGSRVGSFARGRGGAGSSRGGNGSFMGRDPSFNQSQNDFSTSQGLPQAQGFQTSQGVPQQNFQTSQAGLSHGYNSGQQSDMRSQPSFDRSRGGMGSSFSRGQGPQAPRFTRPVATEGGGGGYQERAMHSIGGHGQQGFVGGADANEEWRKKQEEAIARNLNIIPQETPAKKPIVVQEVLVQEVVTIEPEIQIQHVQHRGVSTGEPSRLEKIPTEPIIRHPREDVIHVTPPPSQPRPTVQSQSVPVFSSAVSGIISSVANTSSKSDMEQISEVVGLMAEAFRKLDIFIKSKK